MDRDRKVGSKGEEGEEGGSGRGAAWTIVASRSRSIDDVDEARMVEDARTYLAKRGNVERKDVPPPPLREAPHTLWDALLEQSRARGVPPPNTLPPSLVAHANGTADRDRQRVKIKLKEARNAREAEKKKHVALLAKTRENLHQQPQDPSKPQKGLPALLPEPETSAFWAVVEVSKH